MNISEERPLVYGVNLVFQYCHGLPNVESVKPIAPLLMESGLQPARVVAPETIQVASDIDDLVMTQYVDHTTTGSSMGGLLRETGFPLEVDSFSSNRARWVLTWMEFENNYVKMTLGGWIVATPQEHEPYKEAYAQLLSEVSLKLYPSVRAEYGFIGAAYTDRRPLDHYRFVRKRQIPTLNWIDFFGPEYVAHYGRDVLAGIPGWRVEDLPDGGLMYQSRQHCVVNDMVAHRRWQRQVAAYLAKHGVSIRFDFPAD